LIIKGRLNGRRVRFPLKNNSSPFKGENTKGESKRGEYGVPAKKWFLWGKNPLLHKPIPPLLNSGIVTKGVLEGRSPSKEIIFPLPLIRGRGIKGVPRKIKDFSGCIKGDRVTK